MKISIPGGDLEFFSIFGPLGVNLSRATFSRVWVSESENFTEFNSVKNGKSHADFTLLGRGADIFEFILRSPIAQFWVPLNIASNATSTLFPVLPFLVFFGKRHGKPPKKQGFVMPTEPLKSLEKKGKTLEKTRNSSQGKKPRNSKKTRKGRTGLNTEPIADEKLSLKIMVVVVVGSSLKKRGLLFHQVVVFV